MKKTRYIIIAVAFICALSAVLSSCSKGNKFEIDGNKYVDKKTNISYIDAPASYSPIGIEDKVYGTFKELSLYAITGADPQKWLCEKQGTVFYADGVSLPTLVQMNVSAVDIMLEDVSLVTVTDKAQISLFSAAYASASANSYAKPLWSDDSIEINWRIRFKDESIGLYYTVAYIELKEDYVIESADGSEKNLGKKFFFNRYEGVFAPAGDVLDSYVEEYKEINEV